MTFAEFIAVCFWPLVILFGLLLVVVKDRVVFRFVATWAVATGVLYLGLWVFYSQSSTIAVVDSYALVEVLGFAAIGYCYSRWGQDKAGGRPQRLKEGLADICLLLIGAGMGLDIGIHAVFGFFPPAPGARRARRQFANVGKAAPQSSRRYCGPDSKGNDACL